MRSSRAKDLKGNWHNGWYWETGEGEAWLVDIDMNIEPPIRRSFMVDKNTAGKHTGLNDINAHEICEGDIVHQRLEEFGDVYSEVIWQDGAFYARESKYPEDECLLSSVAADVDIVGTIYDNPELLEV